MTKIKKITPPEAIELRQARIDEAIITGQPFIEKPYYYEHTETNRKYYDLYGCIGWPTEVSEKDVGRPGYIAIMGVNKSEKRPTKDAYFQLLAEYESKDIPTLLNKIIEMRQEYGFGLTPGFLQTWIGDPEKFITTLALMNERLILNGGERKAILVIPPDDFYSPKAFETYVRSLHSAVVPGNVRLYFGNLEILKNRMREFKKDDPAIMAVGGLVHSLILRCTWMDQARENIFTVEET